MENYIVINGKKTELTPEQLEKLGIVAEKNPFERNIGDNYFYMGGNGNCYVMADTDDYTFDVKRYNVANYCHDKSLLEQRALHETLSRLLWRYSMIHGGDKIDWGSHTEFKYCIQYDHTDDRFMTTNTSYIHREGVIYFNSLDVAESAIKEIIEPFMKGNPDFVW